jgi:K+-sensing histidine kinase KdpD
MIQCREGDHMGKKEDISRSKLRQQMLAMMKEEGALISYLQNTAHQMRTPMTLIRSYSELMLAGVYGDLSEDMQEKMETISSNLEEMTYFVDQVQDIGYITNPSLSINISSNDLTHLVEKIASDMDLIGRSRMVTFSLENFESSHEVDMDQHLSRRAVAHLLRYVVSSTPYGNNIKIALKPGKERTLVIVFGFGQVLSKDKMIDIVRSMSEMEAKVTTMEWEQLSLPISRAMMEIQGGDLTIFEDENERTVYVLEFPHERK